MHFVFYVLPIAIFVALYFVNRKEFKVNSFGIVLITGASSGIGLHAAEHLAANSPYVVLAGVRREIDAKMIQTLAYPNLFPIILNVSDHQSNVNAVADILTLMEEKKLPFVGLVNNAGIDRTMPVELHPVEDARVLFDTNFFGVMDLVQLTVPMLRASKGRIVMISSISGFIAIAKAGVYSASKFALEGLTDSLRREVSHYGVSVSVVQPGFVKTKIHNAGATATKTLLSNSEETDRMEKLYAHIYTPEMKAKRLIEEQTASDPIVTSTAITHALTAQYPQTRYPVAKASNFPAVFVSWLDWILTDRLQDFVIENL